MDIVIAILLLAAAIAVSRPLLVNRRKPPVPDPRMVLVAQFEASFMSLIRERYECTDEAAREIRRRFMEWEMDAMDTGLEIAENGKLFVSNDAVDKIDDCALKIGLRPHPNGDGAI